jgi:hypothetical protein
MERFAAQQERTDGQLLASLETREMGVAAARRAEAPQIDAEEIVLYEVDQADEAESDGEDSDFRDLVVSTDVSFPLAIQEQGSIADQLEKLRKLHEGGIINDEELSIAKAKLLS